MNRHRKTLHKDGVSRFNFRYYLSCLENKIDDFQNFLRKCKKKKHDENIFEMDEIWHKKRKMNEDDMEELIGVVKESKERTKSKV